MEAARIFRDLYNSQIDELRMDPPDHVYLVKLDWFRTVQEYLYYSYEKDATEDEAAFLAMVSARHLHVGHPGPLENKQLLKKFYKYIRVDTSNVLEAEDLVCSRKIVEDEDYELISEALWDFIEHSFEADYAIKREKDEVNSGSFRAVYKVLHEDHLKILVLPPLNLITKQSLEDIGKPIKIYYNQNQTFA